MELKSYSLEDILLSAIKSEREAKEVYESIAEGVKNYFLRDRLKFLAGEEEKHKVYLGELYKKSFPAKKMKVPSTTPVPMPQIKIAKETSPISEVLKNAMEAESAAREFYLKFAMRFPKSSEENRMLVYLSEMELGHFRILETERNNVLNFEDYDLIWPMMHAGP